MIRKLEKERLLAELGALESLLGQLAPTDYLGRIGLESRQRELREELARLGNAEETQAKVALFFQGGPVAGSEGVKASFASNAVGSFQDILTNLWGARRENPAAAERGPIRNSELSALHITDLLHGSVGFLLEELDPGGTTLFESSLKDAADQAVKVIGGFADEDDTKFAAAIDEISPRAFKSVQKFLRCIHADDATFRVVEGDSDLIVGREAVERAWRRAEGSKIDEEQVSLSGRLIGVIPIHRKFEFQPDGAELMFGTVGEAFGQSFIERMNTEQFLGKRWRGFFHRKLIERIGRSPVSQYTLLRLDDEQSVQHQPLSE